MMYGPPGTGKTLLARALAGETGRAFFSVSGSEFVEMFVGVGASRVRNLFRQARQQPSIVFIDEIDAIGKRRGQGANNDEREQTLNQILVEMDGFSSRDDVIVLAGTNMLETLDPALLRPGRFSLHVEVGLPNEQGRQAILAVHARSKRLGEDADLTAMAAMTYGMSGAQLEEVLNQAALMCARAGRDAITQTDLREGYMRVLMGPEKSGQVATAEERRVVAWHEAGHAVCGQLLPTQDNPQFVSIRQRGKALGVAVYGQTDRGLHSTRFLHEQLMCVLGGRAAEFVQFGTVSSGAANDLQKANAIARSAVEQLGLSADVGQIISEGATLSEQTRTGIDREVTRMISDAYADAVTLLRAHRRELDELAELLLSAETVERQELELVIGRAGTSAHTPDVQFGPQVSDRSPHPDAQPVERVPVAARRVRRDRRAVALVSAAASAVVRRRARRRAGSAT
jgi:cell division protease FtsH